MKPFVAVLVFFAAVAALSSGALAACADSDAFAFSSTGSGASIEWTLTRGGQPFFIKGVAGPNQSRPGFEEFVSPYGAAGIAALGGNAFKTYGSDVKFGSEGVVEDNLKALQAACNAGVGVAIGIDLLPFGSGGTGFVPGKPNGCSTFPIPADNGQTCNDNGMLNYEDAGQVAVQLVIVQHLIQEILSQATADQRSAIMFWVIGNEVASTGSNAAAKEKVYQAIDEISEFIHGLDQTKPFSALTMTAVPAVSETELGIISTHAPDLDLVGVNDYGGLYDGTLYGLIDQIVVIFNTARANDQWRKPWVLTEWGSYDLGVNPTATLPFGTPFVQLGPDPGTFVTFGTALLLSSTLEAESYAANYNGTIIPTGFGPSNNVGSFVFDWRATAYNRMIANWFEMYVHQATDQGIIDTDPSQAQRTAPAGFVASIWRGETPASGAPVIQQAADCASHPVRVFADPTNNEMVSICPLGLKLVDSSNDWVIGTNVPAGELLTATISAVPGTGSSGPLTYDWFLYGGANGVTGGNVSADPIQHALNGGPTFTFAAPANLDSYRLWAVIRDQGGVPPTKSIDDQTAAKASAVFGVNDVSVVGGATASLGAKGDAFIQEVADHENEGGHPRLVVNGPQSKRATVQFSAETITQFLAEHSLGTATLVLNIAEPTRNLSKDGAFVEAAPLHEEFTEGDRAQTGVNNQQSSGGSGSGVTWACDTDADITNNDESDCAETWRDGALGGGFADATAFSALHVNQMIGEVTWDVTEDVFEGRHAWIVKKFDESTSDRVEYYSREGAEVEGDTSLGPQLVLEEATTVPTMSLTVVNNCPAPNQTLYAYGSTPPNNGNIVLPNSNDTVTAGQNWTTTIPVPWTGGRIWVCPSDTSNKDPWGQDAAWFTEACTWVEPTTLMGVDPMGQTVPTMNMNATFIEGIWLPVKVVGTGGECAASGCEIGCSKALPFASVKPGCPTGFGSANADKCLGMIPFCQQNSGHEWCKLSWFMAQVDLCKKKYASCDSGIGSPDDIDIYGCGSTWLNGSEGMFGQRVCAALNRGVVGNMSQWADPDDYYPAGVSANEFSAWIHDTLECKIYAFSFDDTDSMQGGDVTYFDAEVTVTWCPWD